MCQYAHVFLFAAEPPWKLSIIKAPWLGRFPFQFVEIIIRMLKFTPGHFGKSMLYSANILICNVPLGAMPL